MKERTVRVRDAFLMGALMLLAFIGGDALLRVFLVEHTLFIDQVLFASGLVAAMYVVTWLAMEAIERWNDDKQP